jgi:hypothetical protein
MTNCPRCKIEKNEQSFKSIRGKTLKYCSDCRETSRKYMAMNKALYQCVCVKPKSRCAIHGGASLCACGKQKNICAIHGGSALCECRKKRNCCKKCSNPIPIMITNMIHSAKQSDIKYNRYDANKHVDKCFIQLLMEESTQCFHCKIQMQFIENNNTLCTLERLNNRIGHVKSNCVLACRKCNYSNIGHP